MSEPVKNQLQVIHCCARNHWIVASNFGCKETTQVVANVLPLLIATVTMAQTQKQECGQDCGLFPIATATAHGANPNQLKFNQAAMRSHIVQCFKDNMITVLCTMLIELLIPASF